MAGAVASGASFDFARCGGLVKRMEEIKRGEGMEGGPGADPERDCAAADGRVALVLDVPGIVERATKGRYSVQR